MEIVNEISVRSIIGLSETWLYQSNESHYCLVGYNCVIKSRIGQTGGGIALMVSAEFSFTEPKDIASIFNTAEAAAIEVTIPAICSRSRILILEIYRPPRNSILKFISDLNTSLMTIHRFIYTIYIIRDLNIDMLKFPVNHVLLEFINTLLIYGLYPLINKPTRVTGLTMSAISYIITVLLEGIGHTFRVSNFKIVSLNGINFIFRMSSTKEVIKTMPL